MALYQQATQDPYGFAEQLAHQAVVQNLGIDPLKLGNELINDPGALLTNVFGFDPRDLQQRLKDDPRQVAEEAFDDLSGSSIANVLGGGEFFQLISKAIKISRAIGPGRPRSGCSRPRCSSTSSSRTRRRPRQGCPS